MKWSEIRGNLIVLTYSASVNNRYGFMKLSAPQSCDVRVNFTLTKPDYTVINT